MQKLVWKNANNVELNLTSGIEGTGNYMITNWQGFSNAPLNIQSQKVPFQDGGVFLDALIEQRELSVTLAMQDKNNLETRYRQRREIISAMNPKLGEGYLIYTNDFISKRIKCIPQIPLFENHNSDEAGTPKASLAWTACEPYWEDLQETSVVIRGTTEIQNEGDVASQVRIDISEGSKNPMIINQTNEKLIEINGTYDGSITINTNNGEKSVTLEEHSFQIQLGGTISSIANGAGKLLYNKNGTLIIEDMISGKTKQTQNFTSDNLLYVEEKNYFIGTNGTNIATSYDGENWDFKNIENTQTLRGVCYGDGKFVVVGDSTILLSLDGETWTQVYTPDSRASKVVYSGDHQLFVAVSSSGNYFYTSPDGETWERRTYNRSMTSVYGLAYGNGVFVEVGSDIQYSSDGITWSSATGMTPRESRSIVFSNGLFMAVGYSTDASGDWGAICVSNNGINWRHKYTTLNIILYSVAFANGIFVIGGNNGFMLESLNGQEYTIRQEGIYYISASGGVFQGDVVVINNNFVYVNGRNISKSVDGVNWIQREINIVMGVYSIAFGNNIYVAVGYGGKIATSQDLETWTERVSETIISGIIVNLRNVKYSEELGLFIAVGDRGAILTSPDGENWTSRTSGVTTNFQSLCCNENVIVAVGTNRIMTSTDGITWTERTPEGMLTQLNSVTYGDGKFVAVGGNGNVPSIFESSDNGETWTEILTSLSGYFWSLTYTEKGFYAVGNISQKSEDGITWEPFNFDGQGRAIAYNNGMFVIAYTGVIYNSNAITKTNLISQLTPLSDMTFKLESGGNKIIFSDETYSSEAVVTYRQKYIGV